MRSRPARVRFLTTHEALELPTGRAGRGCLPRTSARPAVTAGASGLHTRRRAAACHLPGRDQPSWFCYVLFGSAWGARAGRYANAMMEPGEPIVGRAGWLRAAAVAEQLLGSEPVDANIRVKYGISEETRARPLQAALTSAASFAAGGSVPLLGIIAGTAWFRLPLAISLSLIALGATGALAAGAGGAPRIRGAVRVFVGGSIAMAISALVGRLIGAAI